MRERGSDGVVNARGHSDRLPGTPPHLLSALQIAEISVNKQLENVQKVTFDDMFGYDAAMKVLDDDNLELAAALWK